MLAFILTVWESRKCTSKRQNLHRKTHPNVQLLMPDEYQFRFGVGSKFGCYQFCLTTTDVNNTFVWLYSIEMVAEHLTSPLIYFAVFLFSLTTSTLIHSGQNVVTQTSDEKQCQPLHSQAPGLNLVCHNLIKNVVIKLKIGLLQSNRRFESWLPIQTILYVKKLLMSSHCNGRFYMQNTKTKW